MSGDRNSAGGRHLDSINAHPGSCPASGPQGSYWVGEKGNSSSWGLGAYSVSRWLSLLTPKVVTSSDFLNSELKCICRPQAAATPQSGALTVLGLNFCSSLCSHRGLSRVTVMAPGKL